MRALLAILSLGLFISGVSPGQAADNLQPLVDRAAATMEAMKSDSSFGNSRELLQRAKAIMIVPQLVKGGFMFGAEGGHGVLLAKTPGGWSNPAFYSIGAASFGLQIGLEEAELVLFVMSDRALHAWMKDEVKLGVNAGLTVLVVGSNAEAALTTHGDVDVIAWARSKGAYAGITLAGSVIKPRAESNADYYGEPLTATQIVLHKAGHNRGAAALRHAIEDVGPRHTSDASH